MSTPRTVVISTSDHGPVAVPEPAWCLGDHGPQQGGHLVDIGHEGPTIAAELRGHQLLAACLVSDPYATRPEHRRTRQMIDLGDELVRLGPAGLDQLAAVLVEHAATLRHLARELSALDREADR